MDESSCFVCAEDCTASNLFLINLSSKKYKTKFTSLIGDFISPEYELRLTNENKICKRCLVLIEKYDELQHETQLLKGVLARQVANTYSIETSEEKVFLDKSKVFVEMNSQGNSGKYSCKLCMSQFVTDCLDTVNSHIMYHKILTDDQIHANDVLKEHSSPKRQQGIARETSRKSVQIKSLTPAQPNPKINVLGVEKVKAFQEQDNNNIYDISSQNTEYDEDALKSLIDLNLLDDPNCESNLKNQSCMANNCKQKFVYLNDYLRHLKLRHRTNVNHMFALIRHNIKRPTKISKLTCPFCFTKISNRESLEVHVKHHEEAHTVKLFASRVDDFIKSIMSTTRCSTCDYEITDPTILECNHAQARSSMAEKTHCGYCNREFYSEKLLNNHLALEHGHCFICSSACDDKIMLRDHIRSHIM
jgi:hypothetical protein